MIVFIFSTIAFSLGLGIGWYMGERTERSYYHPDPLQKAFEQSVSWRDRRTGKMMVGTPEAKAAWTDTTTYPSEKP